MRIQLYHGTSVRNADSIMKDGCFKDRVESGRKNWEGDVLSKAGYVYLTTAYPFFYAMNAAKGKTASVIKVEVDTKDLFPDEDILRFNGIKGDIDIADYQDYAMDSLEKLGNVAIEPQDIKFIVGRKDFTIIEMMAYSDPSMSPLNYRFLGKYYRDLTDKWFNGENYDDMNTADYLTGKLV